MQENEGLAKELEELNVSVNERRNIHEVNGKERRVNISNNVGYARIGVQLFWHSAQN